MTFTVTMVNPGWSTVGGPRVKNIARRNIGPRHTARTLPTKATRRTRGGGKGRGKGAAKKNLKDPPPSSVARKPNKKQGDDNDVSSSDDDAPRTPSKGNLKDDNKYDDENFDTPSPKADRSKVSELTKLQDSGQLEASMDNLFNEDLLSSPKGLRLSQDDAVSHCPHNVMGLYDIQVVTASPIGSPTVNLDVLNSPSAQSTSSRRSNRLQQKDPLFPSAMDDLTAKHLKQLTIVHEDASAQPTAPSQKNNEDIAAKTTSKESTALQKSMDKDTFETSFYRIQQKKYDGLDLNARENLIFSRHLRQLPKHEMAQYKCYPSSRMSPLKFLVPGTDYLYFPEELNGKTPYLCPAIEGKYGDLYEEWKNKSSKIIAQDESVILAKFYGLPIHKSQINRLKTTQWFDDNLLDGVVGRMLIEHAEKRILVFDSFFIRLLLDCMKHKEGMNSEVDVYNYDKVRNYVNKRLNYKRLVDFKQVHVFCNLGNHHWRTVIVFLQQQHIEELDPLGETNDVHVPAIFRWLVDHIAYEEPHLFHTYFDENKPNNGWTAGRLNYRIQSDSHNCGPFAIMMSECVAKNYSMRTLDGEACQHLRKFVFSLMIDETHFDESAEAHKRMWMDHPWSSGPRITPQQLTISEATETLFEIPKKGTRKSRSAMRSILTQENMRDIKIQQKLIQEATKKKYKSRTEREKAEKAQRAREAAAFRREIEQQAQDTYDTQLKSLFEPPPNWPKRRLWLVPKMQAKQDDAFREIFPVAPEDEPEYAKDVKARKAQQPKDLAEWNKLTNFEKRHTARPINEDDAMYLSYHKGMHACDPPQNNPYIINYWVPPKEDNRYVYNYYQPYDAELNIIDTQFNPAWCNVAFHPKYIQLVKNLTPKKIHIPMGAEADDEAYFEAPPRHLLTKTSMQFQQGTHSYCASHALAAALRHMGFWTEAASVLTWREEFKCLPLKEGMRFMMEQMQLMFRSLIVEKYNTTRKRGGIVPYHPANLLNDVSSDIFMLQLVGNNNRSNHMICKANKLIFDARIEYALQAKHEALEWCSGVEGLKKLGVVFRFKNLMSKSQAQKNKKSKHI